MKIAFVCIYSHPSICGVWSRVYNLAKMLISVGHEVHVFSTNCITETNSTSLEYENFENINIHRFKPFLSFGENVKFWDFTKELRKVNPDLIMAEVYRHPHTHYALKLARKLGKPIFLTTHAPFVEPELRSTLDNTLVKFYDSFFGRKINKFNKIIAITRWEIPFLEELGVDKSKLAYIPNGIPKPFFSETKEGSGILFLGRISRIKNLETLILAVSKLKNKDIKLKIVGPCEEKYKQELEKLVKKLGLERKISFHPAIYDLKQKIKIIDDSEIFVLPSKREAMPQSLIEAMARGKIVIASNNKGSAEIIEKQAGFLFPISNSEKLAELIEYCLDKKNNKNLNQIKKNARKKAETFRWEKIFANFLSLLKTI